MTGNDHPFFKGQKETPGTWKHEDSKTKRPPPLPSERNQTPSRKKWKKPTDCRERGSCRPSAKKSSRVQLFSSIRAKPEDRCYSPPTRDTADKRRVVFLGRITAFEGHPQERDSEAGTDQLGDSPSGKQDDLKMNSLKVRTISS